MNERKYGTLKQAIWFSFVGVFVVGLMGCQAEKAMDSVIEVNQRTKETNEKLMKLEQEVRLQGLMIALEKMSDPDSYLLTVPISPEILAVAETFAREATVDEIVKLIYTWLLEINLTHPNPIYSGGSPSQPTDAELEFNKKVIGLKYARLQALITLAGLTPQPKIEQMIQSHILNQSEYAFAALNLLMGRFIYLKEGRLAALKLDGIPLSSVGDLEKSVEALKAMDFIIRLPFSEKITLLINDVELQKYFTVERSLTSNSKGEVTKLWGTLKNKGVNLSRLIASNTKGGSSAINANVRQRLEKALQVIDTRLEEQRTSTP
ncbi:MAG: hypothetical protein K1X29_09615 [Bdellovibrionales bacterium]|nr:hypothetical protein [Bdellovibrionales bacterium]